MQWETLELFDRTDNPHFFPLFSYVHRKRAIELERLQEEMEEDQKEMGEWQARWEEERAKADGNQDVRFCIQERNAICINVHGSSFVLVFVAVGGYVVWQWDQFLECDPRPDASSEPSLRMFLAELEDVDKGTEAQAEAGSGDPISSTLERINRTDEVRSFPCVFLHCLEWVSGNPNRHSCGDDRWWQVDRLVEEQLALAEETQDVRAVRTTDKSLRLLHPSTPFNPLGSAPLFLLPPTERASGVFPLGAAERYA